ncbi:sulfite exporter TauE/SafE family protein [Ponticoccus sp. SC2-23]|uniref:sulfite exporter TauE/SafE family protein n=1 Tax=Alexandriicola marinus TaxID=2081710 RepID=UPI000FD7EC9C|nr:sulfite exporter TauE/SafE family protein [Alexandriicola marinus]MBM1221972.1 sulfite exporter TauE/SafE family protein [Ponticoccus sp. SC6-9]MBM1226323.1 sulfite exporter TauE/SafE family protein [Ponticoccus sp. SC6-15]MBM1230919.1 sulfite exporter TauE/SafE family protein [Ponticoccus sp. SC6-38]MBM1235240.1 sulfite exporter TauE/SafE family protein [Ponticoccus sp. SC6-45]MBM1239941.1 sulfite exporter TauE/SafE family protein [Ponticoccus sp. SC6-49]MBM1244085.1 sulfite exporter TauE
MTILPAWLDPNLAPPLLLFAFSVTLLAGVIKGLVGFAMPMIMVSGLTLILAPDLALAALILPTMFSNLFQAFRGGIGGAAQLTWRFRIYLGTLLIVLLITTQLVPAIPERTFYLILGIPIVLFTLFNLVSKGLTLARQNPALEVVIGSISGFAGGISGVWGPPTVAYLTAINLPKAESVRVQGIIYGSGAIALFLGHARSGILNAQTLPLSLWMIVPAIIGVKLGQLLQDRIDQRLFRRVTLLILLIAGLNLLRRGLT